MLRRLQFSEQRILPSWWLSSGLLEAAHPAPANSNALAWRESLGFLSVLIANACLGILAVGLIGKRCLRSGFGQIKGLGRKRRRKTMDIFDDLVLTLTTPFNPAMRQLLVKDLRIFRRDPVHWSQFMIFFGLLGLYFVNVRRLQYGGPMDAWMTMVGFLNVAVVGLILSTFTTRFIFPMISMEGRRFWVLGTLPIDRDTILWGKLLFACVVSVVPCATLVLLSDFVLKILERAPTVALIHQLTCWSLCIGLSSLAVGLGARLPDFRESSPSRNCGRIWRHLEFGPQCHVHPGNRTSDRRDLLLLAEWTGRTTISLLVSVGHILVSFRRPGDRYVGGTLGDGIAVKSGFSSVSST